MNKLLPVAGLFGLLWLPFCCIAQDFPAAPVSPAPIARFTFAPTAQLTAIALSVRKMYTHRQFPELAQEHKLMAVLPVSVTIEDEKTGSASKSSLQHQAETEAKNAYYTLHAALLREKTVHDAAISFQDITVTQNILTEHHITPEMLPTMSPVRLAALLGVDGVVLCQVVRDRKLVMEASLLQNLRRSKGIVGPTAGLATCTIHDGKTGQLLWLFERQLTESLGWNISQTLRNMGRCMADAFPYFKFF